MPERDVPIVLYGATGYTGRLIASALDGDGVPFVVAGRDEAKLTKLAGELDTRPDIAVVDLGDRASLEALLARATVCISAAGPFAELGPPLVRAAMSTGTHVVDITGEQSYLRWCEDQDGAAREAGISVVNAMGFDVVPSELASVLACRGLSDVARLDLCISAKGTMGRGTSRGTRRSMAGMAGEGRWYDRGSYKLGPPGRFRRTFEMPEPLGEQHAVFIPWGDCVTAPRSTGAAQVRTFFTLPAKRVRSMHRMWPVTAIAERLPPVQRKLRENAKQADEGADEKQRRDARFTILGEATARDGAIQRAVVQGRDPYGLTGAAASLAGQLVAEGQANDVGVLTPSQAFDIEQFCKRLEGFELSWAVL